ncbi:hypothetical protein FRX31_004798 [Thalictrum thalictroides]|uniref:Uncharacterized protein n=1 Tax=Thalictrum thalictroides TaxID=46969 RepID=A0A7J6X7M0_THATH|nr:hypothetical protein FRX31_004798 [Thalictrum thalictroides]
MVSYTRPGENVDHYISSGQDHKIGPSRVTLRRATRTNGLNVIIDPEDCTWEDDRDRAIEKLKVPIP